MSRYLIAPPGTPVDGPGWYPPPKGTVLRWTVDGERPPFAVKRDGVLIADGSPPLSLYFPPCRCGRAEAHLATGDCDPPAV